MKVKEILDTMDYGEAPESPQAALDWIAGQTDGFGLFIDGEITKPKGRQSFETKNPANGQVLATLCQAEEEDVDRAVNAAHRAHPAWEALGGASRAK